MSGLKGATSDIRSPGSSGVCDISHSTLEQMRGTCGHPLRRDKIHIQSSHAFSFLWVQLNFNHSYKGLCTLSVCSWNSCENTWGRCLSNVQNWKEMQLQPYFLLVLPQLKWTYYFYPIHFISIQKLIMLYIMYSFTNQIKTTRKSSCSCCA